MDNTLLNNINRIIISTREEYKRKNIGGYNTIEKLKEYENEEYVFCNFSEIEKLGVNPNSDYKHMAPIGIYAYPVKVTIKYLEENLEYFATKRKYINIFKYDTSNMKYGSRIINTIRYNNLEEDLKKIDLFLNSKLKGLSKKEKEKIVDNINYNYRMFINDYSSMRKYGVFSLWMRAIAISQGIANIHSLKKDNKLFSDNTTKLLRKILVEVLDINSLLTLDPGIATIHPDIASECIFLDPSTIKIIDRVINNKKYEGPK